MSAIIFSCGDETLDSSFYSGGDLGSSYLNGEIKDYISGDISKGIMERVPVYSLVTERCSVGTRFFLGGRVEDVNRLYGMIVDANRAELRATTRFRDGGKKGSLTVQVFREVYRKVNQ